MKSKLESESCVPLAKLCANLSKQTETSEILLLAFQHYNKNSRQKETCESGDDPHLWICRGVNLTSGGGSIRLLHDSAVAYAVLRKQQYKYIIVKLCCKYLIHFFDFSVKNAIVFSVRNWYNGPIVYRLGHSLLKARSGVRLSIGSQGLDKNGLF